MKRFMKNLKQVLFTYIHYVILCLCLMIAIITCIFYFTHKNATVSSEDAPSSPSEFYIPPLEPTATYDFLSPLESIEMPDKDSTIVCLGNAPFSDSKNTRNSLSQLLEEATGATVYNCSIPNSYASAYKETFSSDYAFDAFSFYWLTTAFCVDNNLLYTVAFDTLHPFPPAAKEAVDLLFSIDFSEVNYIFIAYDGSDYLAGRPSSNPENPTDIQTYAGALAAGIELIQAIYPDIHIVVIGAPYLYAYDNNCELTDSRYYDYGKGNMPAYISVAAITAASHDVTFIDTYFDTITCETANELLANPVKLNDDGRKAIIQKLEKVFKTFSD